MSAPKSTRSNFSAELPIGRFVTVGSRIVYIAPPFNPDMLKLVKEREPKKICGMEFIPLYLANQLVGYNIPKKFKNQETYLLMAKKTIGKYRLLYSDNIIVVTGDKKLGNYLVVPYYSNTSL